MLFVGAQISPKEMVQIADTLASNRLELKGNLMPAIPFRVSPMLATLVDAPFSRSNWVFEEKYDGVRIFAYKEGKRVSLVSRNAIDRTSRFPEIAVAVRELSGETLLLDGEVAVFDAQKVSRFQLLQQRKGLPVYEVFDCLYLNGEDLRKQTLESRRAALEEAVKISNLLRLSKRLAVDGLEAFKIASRRGLEGVVGKNLASSYIEKRSREWLKVKVHQESEFVIGGFTAPSGARHRFGALLVGVYSGDRLQYVGKVGTGFDEETLVRLHAKLRKLVRAKSPFASEVRERAATFVALKLVAELSFTEWTKDSKLRYPVYWGLRDDKDPKEVVREGA
jgi:bifunctional non-homologous end joining protein LigD